ncbi:MAG TPA: asparagine synthase-related protein [Stenotrophomonas sp.]|nr:asparagine synthase-related protein [Stenotrophomonas sp.]
MYRYIAVFWNHLSDSTGEQAREVTGRIEAGIPGISCALRDMGAAIYAQSDDAGFFECNRTGNLVVLGMLFTKDFGANPGPRRTVLDPASAEDVCGTQGQDLVQRYWGRYVAFGYDAQARSWFAVRDPSAEIPCYVTVVGELTVVFSNMEDCLLLRLRPFTLDWSYLAYALRYPFRDTVETGFKEISAIEAGEAITITHGKPVARRCHWDIAMAAADDPITDLEEAVDLARSTLLGCIGALASQHPQIQLQLSGGLDSSIVLAGLLHAPSRPEVRCIHHYDSGIGADERAFARMAVSGACRSSGRRCEFIEYERTPDCSLEDMLSFPRTARPAHCSGYLLSRGAWPSDGSGETPVHFTGMGGDGVFLRFKGNAAAIDYAWRHGIDRRLLRVAFETAQSGDSFYGVMKDAVYHGLLKQPSRINAGWGSPCEWVHTGGVEEADRQPAWMRRARSLGIGLSAQKMAHIGRMIFPASLLDPFEGAGRWRSVSPISAQPVVELFARIPIYLLMAGAEDRTIARRAFAGLLPEALLSRRVKSYLDDHAVAVTQHHRAFIRRMLVDGLLARHGFIDSAAADAGIQRVSPDNTSQVLGISGPQLNLETWLRRWSGSAEGASR